MHRHRTNRHILAVVASAALIALTAACGNANNPIPPPTSTPTPTSTTTPPSPPPPVPGPPPAPTVKDVSPTGGNLFTPHIHAPAAPTVRPGQHPGLHGIP